MILLKLYWNSDLYLVMESFSLQGICTFTLVYGFQDVFTPLVAIKTFLEVKLFNKEKWLIATLNKNRHQEV